MKLTYKIALGFSVVAAATIAFYFLKHTNTKQMLAQVADEGYETAHDILFPGKDTTSDVHYGPVFPR